MSTGNRVMNYNISSGLLLFRRCNDCTMSSKDDGKTMFCITTVPGLTPVVINATLNVYCKIAVSSPLPRISCFRLRLLSIVTQWLKLATSDLVHNLGLVRPTIKPHPQEKWA